MVLLDNTLKGYLMQVSIKGLLELADREGLAETPYLDSVNVKTIGIGMTSADIKDLASWPWGRALSIQEAVNLYKQHITPYATAVSSALTILIPQNQFDALVSICYNIGIRGLRNSTFIKRINSDQSMSSIKAAILMWNKPSEIIGRRTKEANLFEYGTYSNNDGCVDHIIVSTITHKPRYSGRIRIDNLL